MPPVILWTLAIAVALVVVLVVIVGWRRERERTEALQRVAETAGLAFEPKPNFTAVRSMGDLHLFGRGHSKRVTNLMTGQLGDQPVSVFDYRYTTGGGKHQHTHSQTVVVLRSPKALPDLEMAPENPLYKVAEAFGFQDIDIESSPEFSRKYIIRGGDPEAIQAALYPGATSYFGEHEGWSAEVRSGTIAIYRANKRPKADDMRAFIDEALTAARSF